jgi:hypothetical protein
LCHPQYSRGFRRSACANQYLLPTVRSQLYLIFCLSFSNYFWELCRSGTRRTPFTATTYACVGYEGFAIDLLRQTMRGVITSLGKGWFRLRVVSERSSFHRLQSPF